ncbi:RNase H domain-containing protein [Trichonephila clavipes]|nr:RNase H domain-containing protein [Trichonephila clavipes]
MDWPAYSLDLNPIEHVGDMLGQRIAAHQPPPTCLPELRRALLDEWCNIPQDQIDNLILSMPMHSSRTATTNGLTTIHQERPQQFKVSPRISSYKNGAKTSVIRDPSSNPRGKFLGYQFALFTTNSLPEENRDMQIKFTRYSRSVLARIESRRGDKLEIVGEIGTDRKRLDLLKYIAGRDWGADAGTLRLTYTSLIRPVLEYGSQIYFSASRTNLAKLDRVQSSAARIITGMRHSCPTDLVLFEADIMPLDLRRKLLLSNRSAIQHLSDWTNVGDKTSVSILKNLKELSQQHEIYFQWIPSHIGLFGNDTADLLAKEGVTEKFNVEKNFDFLGNFSKTKSLIQELWKTPPTHPWYNRQAPGGALSIKADRVVQTTISRLASGHIRGLSFNLGQKIYENCTKCNLVQATPDHLLFCAGLEREDIYSSPLLVYDFLRTLGLMDLV